MKEIPIANTTLVARVDDEDFELLSDYRWYLCNGYAVTTIYVGPKRGNQVQARMHRIIMNTPRGMDTDHRDRDRLNNQKYNLRVATRSQNKRNSMGWQKVARSSKYKGVSWHKGVGKWSAQIHDGSRLVYLGCFSDETEAARAYNARAKFYHAEFALLNPV